MKEQGTQEILLVAIHRELIEKYQNIFRSAGLNVSAFEIEIFSQARSVLGRETQPSLLWIWERRPRVSSSWIMEWCVSRIRLTAEHSN